MKSNGFKIVEKESDINKTDYIVIINLVIWTPSYPLGLQNVVDYDGKKYVVSIMKGMYSNIVNQSKKYLEDKEIRDNFRGMKVLLMGPVNGYMNIIAYKDFQSLIDENLVYRNDQKVNVIVGDEDVIYAIENKTKMISPDIN